jgi:hypothetical protein
MLSRYQNAAAASREYAERSPERYHPGQRQLLIYSLFFPGRRVRAHLRKVESHS